MKEFNEYAATVLLIACAGCFLYALIEYASFAHPDPVVHNHTYCIKTDSLGNITPASRTEIESIIASIKQHEQIIKDRYDYVLEQRQFAEEYLSLGGILVTVILSIFGFFGYKSFKSIEEDAISEAKKIAERQAEDTANDKATKVSTLLNTKLSNELKKQQKKTLQEYKEKDIPSIAADAVQSAFREKVENHVSNIDNNINRIAELESQVVSLQRQIDQLSQTVPMKKIGLRSLRAIPGLSADQIKEIMKNNSSTPNENSEA